MHFSLPLLLLILAISGSTGGHAIAALLPVPHGNAPVAASPGNALRRVANQTLRLPQMPGGFGYVSEPAFPVVFDQPLAISSPPGETNRLFIVEKTGRIIVMTNLATPSRKVFLDLSNRVFPEQECGLLGLAFHPKFAQNGYFYVTYTFGTFWAIQLRLARFKVSASDPNTAQPDSETPLYTLADGDPWHEGGDLHFGPDGYLYVSVGDGGFGNENGQRIDRDAFSGILRLDVDKRPENPAPNPRPGVTDNYAIPVDNPFVGVTRFNGVPVDPARVRTEFYVVGLRNPWRFAFDPLNGDLYSNDTGENYREEMNVILKGANYGWPFMEGSHNRTNVISGMVQSATVFPPLSDYGYEGGGPSVASPGSGKALTAGILYRGTNLPALDGAYLFSDFWSGDIGLIRPGTSDSLNAVRVNQSNIQLLEAMQRGLYPLLGAKQVEWEMKWLEKDRMWQVLVPSVAVADSGIELVEQPDHSLLASGEAPWWDNYTILARTDLTNVTALRLELLPDDSLPGRGPGLSAGGNIVLTDIDIHAAPAQNLAASESVELAGAVADYSQAGWEIDKVTDGDAASGWSIAPALGQPHQAVFNFTRPVGFRGGTVLAVVLRQNYLGRATIGRFRIAVASALSPLEADAYPLVADILRLSPISRTEQQKTTLAVYYRSIDPEVRTLQGEIERQRKSQIETLNRQPLPIEWIAREPYIASFGRDPRDGGLLMADLWNGVVRRLRWQAENLNPFPERLQDTGIFSDLATLTPNPGIVPYSVNVSFWSDQAVKRRWFSVPDPNQKIVFKQDGHWEFPPGSVWIKHFELEITNGLPASARRLETRVLVRNPDGVHGATYRWDASGRNASLVGDAGLDEPIVVHQGGVVRTQVWRYPSRSQCLQCHTSTGGSVLGFNTVQLNRDMTYGTVVQNQIRALDQAGYFALSLPDISTLPALADATEKGVCREYRVRSYLHANCVQCHQPGGSARSVWDARITTPLSLTGLIEGVPVLGTPGPRDRLIARGSIEDSVLWQRLSAPGPNHMPPLGTSLVNTGAVALLRDWIKMDLPSYETYPEWQDRYFEGVFEASEPMADPDGDGTPNYTEYLLGTDPLAPSEGVRVSIERSGNRTFIKVPRIPNLSSQIEWTHDPSDPLGWFHLAVPGNAPFYSATTGQAVIEDTSTSRRTRFYRVVVRRP